MTKRAELIRIGVLAFMLTGGCGRRTDSPSPSDKISKPTEVERVCTSTKLHEVMNAKNPDHNGKGEFMIRARWRAFPSFN